MIINKAIVELKIYNLNNIKLATFKKNSLENLR